MRNQKRVSLGAGEAYLRSRSAAELAAVEQRVQAAVKGSEQRIRAAMDEARVDVEAHGFTLPRSIEQCEALALAVGLPEQIVWGGGFTVGELRPLAARWATMAQARMMQEQAYRTLHAAASGIVVIKSPAVHRPRRGSALSKGWTQTKLGPAIHSYLSEHGSEYQELLSRTDRGAVRDAQKIFGRNTIARALQTPATMVGNSRVWQDIADTLGLRRKRGGLATSLPVKVGFDLALEARAGDTTWAEVQRRETLQLLNETLQKAPESDRAGIEDLLDQVQRGTVTDDRAREILALYASQNVDRKSRRALGP